MDPIRTGSRAIGIALVGLLCCAPTIRAQVQLGNDTQLTLDGSVSAGYSASISNEGPDTHGLGYGGVGNLSGSFYSPQFLSFNVAPFFNQSRNNSNYQSITESSGVTATTNIFSGSRFPGKVSYSKIFNNESNNFVVPGLANYATNGNTQTFGVGWSANLETLPSVTVGYEQGDNNYSLYGTQQESSSHFHTLFGTAVYLIDGYHLTGGIHYTNNDSAFPRIVSGEVHERASGDSTTYTAGMSRAVDLSGNTWVNFTRNTSSYNSLNVGDNQSTDIVTGGLNLRPIAKLSTQISADYDDNLSGTIIQQVTSTGAIVPVSLSGQPSHSWGLVGNAQYSIIQGLYVDGIMSYREQLYEGSSFDATSYGGSVGFGHRLFAGQFSSSLTATHSTSNSAGESTNSLLGSVMYVRRIGEWSVSGSFGYSQHTQTYLLAYTSSGYSYSATASRPIGRLHWNGSASASKSSINQASDLTSKSQAYSMGLSGRWLSVSGAYGKSHGSGLMTASGVNPLPPGVPPSLVPTVLYSGTTYSASVASTPVRGLSVTGSYIQTRSNTGGEVLSTNGKSEQAYVYLTYRVRKVYLNAGYSRLLQGFSGNGVPPTLLTTYYIGLSRWFKAF